jgi:hypothetical protein
MAIDGFHIAHILTPSESATLVILSLVTLVATICLGYYAAKIFLYMRLGRLERGWMLVTGGAICLCFAFLSLAFQHLFPGQSHPFFYLNTLGMTFSIAGMFLMVLGLRSHYLVWTRKTTNRLQKPLLLNQRRDIEE